MLWDADHLSDLCCSEQGVFKWGRERIGIYTKDEAKKLGWRARKANLAIVAPNRMLAKGIYWNDDGHLPMADGRQWFEADIDYVSGNRNNERIVYSNDGLVFITMDHFVTFFEVVSQS